MKKYNVKECSSLINNNGKENIKKIKEVIYG